MYDPTGTSAAGHPATCSLRSRNSRGSAPPLRRRLECQIFRGWRSWSSFMIRIENLGSTVCGLRCMMYPLLRRRFVYRVVRGCGLCSWFMIYGSQIRIWGLGLRAYGRWVSVYGLRVLLHFCKGDSGVRFAGVGLHDYFSWFRV